MARLVSIQPSQRARKGIRDYTTDAPFWDGLVGCPCTYTQAVLARLRQPTQNPNGQGRSSTTTRRKHTLKSDIILSNAIVGLIVAARLFRSAQRLKWQSGMWSATQQVGCTR